MANLITQPQAFTNAYWFKSSAAIVPTDNTTVAPDGTTTASTLTMSGANAESLRNTAGITVVAATAYVFEFWAKAGTLTNGWWRAFDNTHAADIVASASYFSLINSSTFTRIELPFTTPAGCTSVFVYPMSTPATSHVGTEFIWNAYLATAASVPDNAWAPVVSGSAPVGSVLSTTNGGWFHDDGTYTYQWTRDGSNIAAATSSTYTTVSADSAHAVGCTVFAHNANGNSAGTASSNTITPTAVATKRQSIAPSIAPSIGPSIGGR